MIRECLICLFCTALGVARADLRAGAAAVDISPQKFPVVVNGMFEERTANRAVDPLHARCLVLDDGVNRIALVVVDNCGLPRELIDQAKELATKTTGIPTDRMMISATHTHSAPSCWPALGSRPDPDYAKFLPPKLAEAIERANKNLVPARAGWTVVQDHQHTHNRRWIRRPDRLLTDPFGVLNVRANMHPGHQNPDVIGPSGPVDPDLSLLSVQTRAGRPLALFANYSMHYYDSPLLSADYYGKFADKIGRLIGADEKFVGIMSQGTSGDLMWMDYGAPRKEIGYDAFAEEIARAVYTGYQTIRYRNAVPLAMREKRLVLSRRLPDETRLNWARATIAKIGNRQPNTWPEIYAHEALYLHNEPTRELKLQAIRIGDLAIAAIPNEVFAVTGLKLKLQSPLVPTFNIGLANGVEGYIPPPEQHALGGYTTWAARSAGLEVNAEPKIVDALLGLLEDVSGKPRRKIADPTSSYARSLRAAKPVAHWKLNDIAGPTARDSMGNNNDGVFEPGVAFYLDGFDLATRASHFAGGRMNASVKQLGDTYSVAMWFWNGLPNDARLVTGYLFSRGPDGNKEAIGDHLGIGGTHRPEILGKLIFFNGNQGNELLIGRTDIALRQWHHVVLVRAGRQVKVYLNGNATPDLEGEIGITVPADTKQIFLGGRNDNLFNFEGKLTEAALFNRVLAPKEVEALYKASGMPPRANAPPPPKAKSPEEEQKTFRVADDLRVELVASEPQVIDPVDMAFDEDGRLWVVEMGDYPSGPPKNQLPRGRIKMLEDRDGDGRYETATVFADGLLYANGLMPWRRGVIVTCAPQILFLNQNGVREILFDGFNAGNPQLRVNHPTLGMDNWIYVANGRQSDRTTRALGGNSINISSSDFRFDLIRHRAEAVSGMGQFGLTFDDWGRRFMCSNRNHIIPIGIPTRYLARNPFLAPPAVVQDNQGIGGAAPIFPLTRHMSNSPLHMGTFTAACGVTVYRGSLLKNHRGAIFTCDPTGNLVHEEILSPDGAGFRWRPAREGVELLASTDPWFRPVNLAHGPDGALYVVDMYRAEIEHPEWLPADQKNNPNLSLGNDRGRIWRIVPKNHRSRAMWPQLSKASLPELVRTLELDDGWWRMTAHRLLMERQDQTAVEPLQKLALKSHSSLARLHAAWLLDGLQALDRDTVFALLNHKESRLREAAVQFAEHWLVADEPIRARVLALVDDTDARVRWQVALSLGEWDSNRILPSLAKIAVAGAGDQWTQMAVASAVPRWAGALNEQLLRGEALKTLPAAEQRLLLREFAELVGARRDASEVARMMEAAASASANRQLACLEGLAAGMSKRGTQLSAFSENLSESLRKHIVEMLTQAAVIALDNKLEIEERLLATRLLAHATWDTAEPVLTALLREASPELRLVAVRALSAHPRDEVAARLMGHWKGYTPALRREVTEVMMRTQQRIVVLLGDIENGNVRPSDLDATRVNQLLNDKRTAVREQAKKVLQASLPEERAAVMERYKASLTLASDTTRGKIVFQKNCASCHRVAGVGINVGPDVSDAGTKSWEQLLQDILNPNGAIDTNYTNYIVTKKDGETLTGLIAAETASGVILRRAENQTETILRADIAEIRSSGVSLMPEGLEKGISPPEMADLLDFLKNWRLRGLDEAR